MTSIPSEVREYLKEIGRKGGSSKSEKKLAAVALNGKKGGWHAQKRNQIPAKAA
jgi:general stress protein YciG